MTTIAESGKQGSLKKLARQVLERIEPVAAQASPLSGDEPSAEDLERRRSFAASAAWQRLQDAFQRAGQPHPWFSAEVRAAESQVEQSWVSAQTSPAEDARFRVDLLRWEQTALAAIQRAASTRARSAMFFSFDGLDGAGKTTQMDLFCVWLGERGHDVVRCHDPGSTPLGEQVREMLLGHRTPIARTTEMLLFMAARAQLVEDVIRPALAQRKTIVSDRYLLANLVYQGHAGGLDVDTIRSVGQTATGGIMPDLVFVLDMPSETAAGRIDRQRDRMESQGADYQQRLRQGFLAEAARDPRGIVVVDATREIGPVQADIRAAAETVLVD